MRSMGIVMVLAALASTPLGAAELSRQVTDVTAIVEPEMGAGRVIFRADISVEDESVAVRRALLRVPLRSIEISRGMTLRVHPVTRDWARGAVSWTSGWSRAGGDFEDRVHGRAEVGPGRTGEAIFDITVLAKEILEHDVANRGFILTIDPGQGLGLPGEDLSRLGALSGATVEVQYRPVPPRGRRAS